MKSERYNKLNIIKRQLKLTQKGTNSRYKSFRSIFLLFFFLSFSLSPFFLFQYMNIEHQHIVRCKVKKIEKKNHKDSKVISTEKLHIGNIHVLKREYVFSSFRMEQSEKLLYLTGSKTKEHTKRSIKGKEEEEEEQKRNKINKLNVCMWFSISLHPYKTTVKRNRYYLCVDLYTYILPYRIYIRAEA